MSLTAKQLREAIADLPDECPILISIDVSTGDEPDEDEAGKRAFGDELYAAEAISDRRGTKIEVALCFGGYLNY